MTEVSSRDFNNMILRYAKEEQKNVVYYMFRSDQELELNFMALSKETIFESDCVFVSVQNPSAQQFQGMDMDQLPTVGVVGALDPEFQEGSISQTNVNAKTDYETLLENVAKLSNHLEDLQRQRGQNSGTTSKTVRNFGEITSNEEFMSRCISYRKGCAIGLLPANLNIDYERENFEEHVEILSKLDEKARMQSQPVFFSWINVTCHPEWLKFLDIDQFQIPTVAFYYPERELQANLIGKFDEETIESHQDRFLKGKLATWAPKTSHGNMITESIDCQAALGDSDISEEDRLLEEEILREIMEEEALREREENTRKNINAKKSGGKKKKSKKKKSKKEDL